jgi:Flp pilus assembly protein TadD
VISVTHGWEIDVEAAQREGVEFAREAIDEAGYDPSTLAMAGLALANLGRDHDGALLAVERALALSPHTAAVLYPSAWVHLWSGDGAGAVKEFAEALRLSPVDPAAGVITSGLALAHLMCGDIESAVSEARRAVRLAPYFLPSYRTLAVALVQAQREGEAAQVVLRLREIGPAHSIVMWRRGNCFRHDAFSAMFIDALRKAGMPEQ